MNWYQKNDDTNSSTEQIKTEVFQIVSYIMLNSQANFAQIHSIPQETDELKVRANLIRRDAE